MKPLQVNQYLLTLHGHPVALGTNTSCQAFGGAKIQRHIIGGNPKEQTVLTKETGLVPCRYIVGLKWELVK